jgi:hypothetical protein
MMTYFFYEIDVNLNNGLLASISKTIFQVMNTFSFWCMFCKLSFYWLFRSSVEDTATVIGPLTTGGGAAAKDGKQESGPFVYTFSHWAK